MKTSTDSNSKTKKIRKSDGVANNNNNLPLDFVTVFDAAKPALSLLFQYSDWKTIFRLGRTCSSLHHAVRNDCRPEYGKPFGDEAIMQQFDGRRQQIFWKIHDDQQACRNINHQKDVLHDQKAARPAIAVVSKIGDPKPTMGPSAKIMDAIQVNHVGQVIRLNSPITLGSEWTICSWIYIQDGRPHRSDGCDAFLRKHGADEYALVGSSRDDQQVFCRGSYLGCFVCDAPLDATLDNNDKDGFFSSQFSFESVPDGWHHIAGIGTMEGDMENSKFSSSFTKKRKPSNFKNRNHRFGWTNYYLDGEKVGCVPYNLRTPISYIGNVSEEEYGLLSQQWGVMADFRIFQRALTKENILLLAGSRDACSQNS